MYDLIRSTEFGDWLTSEISQARLQSKSANLERAHAAILRLESLKVVRQVLLDFLLIQQAMLDEAQEVRVHRTPRNSRSGRAVSTSQIEIDAG